MLASMAILGVASIFGILMVPVMSTPPVEMYIEPAEKTVSVGDTFTIDVMVRSDKLVNVFAGELRFDEDVLSVTKIDYNTSIADLWAEKPWYENGEGTLNFAGGTTKGGFTGDSSLITVTLRADSEGKGMLDLHNPRILRHDGAGTDVALPEPIDVIFTVTEETLASENMVRQKNVSTPIDVIQKPPTTDLNGDGRQSIIDISIFILHIGNDNPRYDFNLDGKVNTRDLSIITDAM